MKTVKSYGVFMLIAMAVAFFTEVKAMDSHNIAAQEVVVGNSDIQNVFVTITAENFSEVNKNTMNELNAEFTHFISTTNFTYVIPGGGYVDRFIQDSYLIQNNIKEDREVLRAERKRLKDAQCKNHVPERLRQIKNEQNPRFHNRKVKNQHANVARLSKRNHR